MNDERVLYLAPITVPEDAPSVEVKEVDGQVFLIDREAVQHYWMSGRLRAIASEFPGENYALLTPSGAGDWLLAALKPRRGRYRFAHVGHLTGWTDFVLQRTNKP